jgi:hypothetical protein
VVIQGRRVSVPTYPLVTFAEAYNLSDTIRDRLIDEGFKTTGGLLEAYETSMVEVFKNKEGHVAEVKKALKQFLNDYGDPLP